MKGKSDTVFGFGRKKGGAAAAGGGDDDDDEDENESAPPPKGKVAGKGAADASMGLAPLAEGAMSRREREAAEAERKKADYMRRHLAGETEEARKDMERLAIIKKRREDAAKERAKTGKPAAWTSNGEDLSESSDSDSDDDEDGASKTKTKSSSSASAPAPLSAAAAKKKAAATAVEPEVDATDGGDPSALPKLKAMDIKKMNGDALKDALKARGLDVQGQKKDLMKRLTDFETARA